MNKSESDEDLQNIVEMLDEDGDIQFPQQPIYTYEEELKRDKTIKGKIIFNLYRFWVFLNYFENIVQFGISLTAGTIAQLLFLETSDNINQGIVYSWLTAIATYLCLLVIYGACWLCGASEQHIFSYATKSRAAYFITICGLLALSIYALIQIQTNCFDSDGNYRKPKIESDKEAIIYCDINSFF